MKHDHVAFLRGVSNVPMKPLRDALGRLGLTEVESFGASGNLVFRAQGIDVPSLQARIAEATGAKAFVRTRSELESVVGEDPYAGRAGASVFLADRVLAPAHRRMLEAVDFEGDPPVVRGATVYFVHPTRIRGRKGIVDFERELGVGGTMRGSRVLRRILEMM